MKQIINGVLYDTALCEEIIFFQNRFSWEEYFKTSVGEFLVVWGFGDKKACSTDTGKMKVISLADISQELENRPATQQVYEVYTKLFGKPKEM